MVDLSVTVGGVHMSNPIMPASGSIAEGMADLVDLGKLGAIVLKTITPDIRQGVKPPRVVEYTDATLFSIGIPSKGPDYLLNHTVPFFARFGPPVIASISADTAEDFGTLAGYITDPRIAAIEANISCPNLRAHGRAFGMDPVAAAEVISAMKANTHLPIWAKLTPNVGDIAEIARAVEDAGADAVVTANAILGMGINAETMTPRLGNVVGGLTGPAVKPVILRMVNQCAEAVKIPIIGCGGITTGEDVVEYMLAGASAVQIGTINFVHTAAMEQSIAWVEGYCTRKNIARVEDLTGALKLPVDQKSEQRDAVAL